MTFETIFLTVLLNGDIHIKPQYLSMFRVSPIPHEIIQECKMWSNINPYNKTQMGNPFNELMFMECIYYDMGEHEHAIL